MSKGNPVNDVKALIKEWSFRPDLFVEEALRVGKKYGGRGLSTQQKHALLEIGKLVKFKIKYGRIVDQARNDNPFAAKEEIENIIRKCIEEKMTDSEIKYAKKRGISIMSGQGTGKDALAAWLILWFLICFPNPKIPCTAPTQHQLYDILWAEVSKWMRHSERDQKGGYLGSIVTTLLEWQKTKIFLKEREGREWFAIARTANVKASAEDQAETLAGFHEDFQMFVIDEASGVPDPVFKPLEGTMTGLCNFAVVIFNPTKTTGAALHTQTKERDDWIALRWNAEESENVSRDHIDFMKRKYGVDSNIYRIRVQGLPPKSEDGKLIPWDWIEAAASPERLELIKLGLDKFDPLKKGVDVGGGGDTTEICTRQGGLVQPFKTKDEEDTMKVAAWIEADIIDDEPDEVCLDNVGLGRGVYDRLRDFGRKIRGINVRNTAFDSRKFFQMRDELCWRLRAEFENGTIAIPNDDELMEQLSQPGFELNSSGQIVVESKKKMKAKGMPSPNKFDALMLTYFTNDKSYRQNKMDETDEYEKAFKSKENRGGDFSWLGA